jgi:hypothetical protein
MQLEIVQAVKAVGEEGESVCGDVARNGPGCSRNSRQELQSALRRVHHAHTSRCIPLEESNNEGNISI